jgi:hypothetical protein
MFRRLILVIFVIIFATLVRHAAAQDFVFRGRDLEKIMALGYTKEELVEEKKLLAIDKSRTITWEDFPLIQLPRFVSVPDSVREKLADDKLREWQQSKVETAQKRFVDAKLKDRTFSGTVRIARKEQKAEKFTIYSKEPSRPKWTGHRSPPAFAGIWPTYFCQWQSDSNRDFKVGENVEIIGKIEDLKEDGKSNTLFLKSVVIATEAAKKKMQ